MECERWMNRKCTCAQCELSRVEDKLEAKINALQIELDAAIERIEALEAAIDGGLCK